MTTNRNKNLNEARKNRNDEFYPQLDEITPTISKYSSAFAGKNIYLNTDDYTFSKTWELFINNFNNWKLKSLTATGFKSHKRGVYANTTDGINITSKYLFGDGDYRSPECQIILNYSDIVVTCPPYSLNKEFINDMVASNKQFLILVGFSSFTYNTVIEHLINHKFFVETLHIGPMEFKVPDEYEGDSYFKEDNCKYARVQSAWISNIFSVDESPTKTLALTRDYFTLDTEKKIGYPDNIEYFDIPLYSKAMNTIPKDYVGSIRLPITAVMDMNRNNIINTNNGKLILLGTSESVYGEHRLYVNGQKMFPGLIFFKTK